MAKVKIDMPGWETYNGLLGMVPFENGVSTRDLTPMETTRLGAIMKIVQVGSDEQVGPSVTMANTRHVSASVTTALPTANEVQPEEEQTGYTEDQLIRIGEDGGIKAIRAIADEFGVKGIAINSLIEDILKAQAAK